jgi:anti-anti-sigma factor
MTDLVTLTVDTESPGTATVSAVGEIDLSNCDELDQALNKLDGAQRVVVDLSLCDFFDSSCLGVLTRHARRLREEGKEFQVRVDDQGRRVIELTNLSELLGLDDGDDSQVDQVNKTLVVEPLESNDLERALASVRDIEDG